MGWREKKGTRMGLGAIRREYNENVPTKAEGVKG